MRLRELWFIFILIIAFGLQPSAANADSTYKDFTVAWAERDARYVQQHAALDKDAREATKAFLADPKSEESDGRLERMLAAIKSAMYIDGRGSTLRAFRIFMEKKRSAAAAELWMQERSDAARTSASALEVRFATLKSLRANGKGGTDAYFAESVAAISDAATLQGQVDELGLIDQNLGSYFRAKGQEDAARRETRARIFGAIGASLSTYSKPAPSWSARCNTYGTTTTCTGF